MIRPLACDDSGAALVEFALIAPVLLLLGMGLSELAYEAYMEAVVTGAVQQAGRAGTIQGATAATVDANVLSVIQRSNARAAFVGGYPTRKTYADYGYIAPEPFTDSNSNGVHDAGECFTDVNANGVWDSDPGTSGMGGAGDTVVYTVQVTYPRPFPMASWLGWDNLANISVTTILKNQPYATQQTTTPATVCA
ncbi:pilus assembly protein [Novosphingobium sp. FSY-8]|uniref:Pilus assembly protein n=1 Tax=Novosphingobium ovatum TaxID=1908523 RepID=A0ABW9XHA6_9SPHN|nr:TadE/TadG family type IV pilus assembly protein [Novosphingobium ovatum]NBC37891.1 pilus assembly protein [Novosphingobium ovatum]